MKQSVIRQSENGSSISERSMSQQLSSFLRDNEFIRSGYRAGYSLTRLASSLFEVHNETGNVWTHLLPGIIIFSVLLYSSLALHRHIERKELALLEESIEDSGSYILRFYDMKGNIRMGKKPEAILISIRSKLLRPSISLRAKLQQLRLINQGASVRVSRKLKRINKIVKNSIADLHQLLKQIYQQQPSKRVYQVKLHSIRQKLLDSVMRAKQMVSMFKKQVKLVPEWPLLLFLACAVTTTTCSSIYHLFRSYSRYSKRLLMQFDFAGIALMFWGSTLPYFIYCSQCYNNIFAIFYTTVTSVASITCFIITFFYPKKQITIFVSLGVVCLVPIFHAIFNEYFFDSFGDQLSVIQVFDAYFWSCVWYILGIFFLASKVPQRLVPGVFDIWGGSHQLWHICVLLGMWMTYQGHIELYHQRRLTPCP